MNIKEMRIRKGLLQKDVLTDIGLLSKIENGKALTCPSDTERIASLFEVSPKDLFTDEETVFFGDKLFGGNFVEEKQKKANKGVCKSEKLRKCFWLDRKTNDILNSAVKTLGHATTQEWFNIVVDETIRTAFPEEEAEYVNSDYMGREVCK